MHKIIKNYLLTALLVVSSLMSGHTQSPAVESNFAVAMNHDKKSFADETGRVFWNAELPVYLSISSKPTGEDYALNEVKSEPMKEFGNPMYFDGHGVHYILHKDYEHNVPEQEVAFAVHVDGKKPISRAEFQNSTKSIIGNRVFFGKNLSVNIIAKDEMSGIDNIYYSIDNEEIKTFAQELNFDSQALYDLQFYSVDKVGNIEDLHHLNFEVDLEAPVTKHQVIGDMEGDILSSRSKISLASLDNLAGVKNIKYSIDGDKEYIYYGNINLYNLSEGEHTLKYYSTDKVNNSEQVKSYSFFLDKSAPELTTEIVGDNHETSGKTFVSERSKLKIIASDNKAGVSKIYYVIDGKEKQEYSEPFSVSELGSGNHAIAYMAEDKVANKTKYKTDKSFGSLNFDKTAPKLSFVYIGAKFITRDTVFITDETKVKLTANDYQSGVQKIGYLVDANSSMEYSDPFTIKEDGFHQIKYSGTDNVNNESNDEFFTVVDSKGPEIFYHLSIDKIGTQKLDNEDKTYSIYSKHAKLYLAATDEMVGTHKIYYSIDGGPERLYVSAIPTLKAGLWKVKVRAIDKLGNSNALEPIEFVIQ